MTLEQLLLQVLVQVLEQVLVQVLVVHWHMVEDHQETRVLV